MTPPNPNKKPPLVVEVAAFADAADARCPQCSGVISDTRYCSPCRQAIRILCGAWEKKQRIWSHLDGLGFIRPAAPADPAAAAAGKVLWVATTETDHDTAEEAARAVEASRRAEPPTGVPLTVENAARAELVVTPFGFGGAQHRMPWLFWDGLWRCAQLHMAETTLQMMALGATVLAWKDP